MEKSLLDACTKKLSGISFPAIGTGALGFPPNKVAKIFYDEVVSFSMKNPNTSLQDIRFVIFYKDRDILEAFQKEMESRKPIQSLGTPATSRQVGKLRVEVVKGDLTKETTEAVAILTTPNLDAAFGGGVSAAILRIGGESIREECIGLGVQSPGSIVSTNSGNLKTNKIYHIVPTAANTRSITKDLYKCPQKADDDGIKSVSLPVFGTGAMKTPVLAAAEAMKAAVEKTNKGEPNNLQLVRIVVFQEEMFDKVRCTFMQVEAAPTAMGRKLSSRIWTSSSGKSEEAVKGKSKDVMREKSKGRTVNSKYLHATRVISRKQRKLFKT